MSSPGAAGDAAPEWPANQTESYDAPTAPAVRERYAEARDLTIRQVVAPRG